MNQIDQSMYLIQKLVYSYRIFLINSLLSQVAHSVDIQASHVNRQCLENASRAGVGVHLSANRYIKV